MEGKKSLLQHIYANPKNPEVGQWDKVDNERSPQYGKRLYVTLKNGLIIPQNMDGFVFLSVSANKATKEKEFAEALDADVKDKKFTEKPLIIASDFAGVHRRGRNRKTYFKPIFNSKNSPKLQNVDFQFLSADADSIPLADKSVDVLMDRYGAAHETITFLNNFPSTESELALLDLLKKYLSKIKKNGKIILDAEDRESTIEDMDSTGKLIEYLFNERKNDPNNFTQHIKQIGLRYRFIGEGRDRVMILERI